MKNLGEHKQSRDVVALFCIFFALMTSIATLLCPFGNRA
jgi:hypothetical protein